VEVARGGIPPRATSSACRRARARARINMHGFSRDIKVALQPDREASSDQRPSITAVSWIESEIARSEMTIKRGKRRKDRCVNHGSYDAVVAIIILERSMLNPSRTGRGEGGRRLPSAAACMDRRVDSATTIDHPYGFMDFGSRDLLPPSIMLDFTLCHRVQIQSRLNAPNKYVMSDRDRFAKSFGKWKTIK